MGKSPPRASLSVTILDDDDFHVLMAMPSGLETFGAFCSLLVVGRERFQQGKADHLGETESLVFTNRLSYVLSRARIDRRQLDSALAVLRAMADETDTLPWLSLDGDRLVIRSFFKYHSPPDKNWGGTRPGAGRKIKNQDDSENNQDDSVDERIKMIPGGNQDDSENNQDDSPGNQVEKSGNHLEKNKESSRKPPVSNSDSNAIAKPASAPASDLESGSFEDCLLAVAEHWGDQNADHLRARRKEVAARIDASPDPDVGPCRPRWDCYLAAVDDLARRLKSAGGKSVDNPVFYAIPIAQGFMADGIPPPPVPVIPFDRSRYQEPAMPEPVPHVAPPDSPFRKAAEALGPRWEHNPPRQPGAKS
jgi:hypothetical protein